MGKSELKRFNANLGHVYRDKKTGVYSYECPKCYFFGPTRIKYEQQSYNELDAKFRITCWQCDFEDTIRVSYIDNED